MYIAIADNTAAKYVFNIIAFVCYSFISTQFKT